MEAGSIAISYFGRVHPVEKADKSPVTEADIEIDRFLTKKIQEKYREHLILSEEMEKKTNKKTENILWAVDPIDGTAAFSDCLPVWGISIGVLVRDRPEYGVFYMPVTDDLYYSDGKTSYLRNKKLQTSFKIDVNSFLAVPSDCHRNLNLTDFPGKTRSMGSIAAHLCYVASGIAIGAVMKPGIWDIAGGYAILKTAGGEMLYSDGDEINWTELYSCNKTEKYCIAGKKDTIHLLSEYIKPYDR